MSLKDIFEAIKNAAHFIWTADLIPIMSWFGLVVYIIFTFVNLLLSLIAYYLFKTVSDLCFKKLDIHHSKFKFFLKPIFIFSPFLFAALLHFTVMPKLFLGIKLDELNAFIYYSICSAIISIIWFLYIKFFYSKPK